MRVAIDASNLLLGGGVTHLREVLAHLDPAEHGIERIAVWSARRTLDRIQERPWLEKHTDPALERSTTARFLWQRRRFSRLARTFGADVALAPGSTFLGDFRPFVTISQSLLPFDRVEVRRHGLHAVRLRLELLARLQARTFCRANGVIFLSEVGRAIVEQRVPGLCTRRCVVPHGIADRFFREPRPVRPASAFTADDPARLLYISHISSYKHQWIVAEAVRRVREAGVPVVLDLIGPVGFAPARQRLERELARIDPLRAFVRYRGAVSYDEIDGTYAQCDLFVFASTCESFGMIVLEAMASGLPIACSDRSAPPEVLGSAGTYFDPLDAAGMARTITRLLRDAGERRALARAAFERARLFDWKRCARDTFDFVAKSANGVAHKPGKAGSRPRPAHLGGADADNTVAKHHSKKVSHEARILFDSVAQTWEEKYSRDGSMVYRGRRFLTQVQGRVTPGTCMLDFGCASGDLTSLFSSRGYAMVGIDQAAEMVNRARERFGSEGIRFVTLDSSHEGRLVLPFPDGEFGAVIASSVAEYLVPVGHYLAEMQRVCATGGYLFMTVPGLRHPLRWFEQAEHMAYRFISLARPLQTIRASYLRTSVNRFSIDRWRTALRTTGWETLSIEGERQPLVMIVARKV